MGSSYHTLIMTEYPEKSIGKPNPLLTPGSESDPELRHWGGPPAVNGEKDKTQPKTKMNDNLGKWTIETVKTKGTLNVTKSSNCLHEGPGRYISGPGISS